jgi:hypothetical protein
MLVLPASASTSHLNIRPLVPDLCLDEYDALYALIDPLEVDDGLVPTAACVTMVYVHVDTDLGIFVIVPPEGVFCDHAGVGLLTAGEASGEVSCRTPLVDPTNPAGHFDTCDDSTEIELSVEKGTAHAWASCGHGHADCGTSGDNDCDSEWEGDGDSDTHVCSWEGSPGSRFSVDCSWD